MVWFGWYTTYGRLAAPVPNGQGYRMVVDYRKANTNMESVAWPMAGLAVMWSRRSEVFSLVSLYLFRKVSIGLLSDDIGRRGSRFLPAVILRTERPNQRAPTHPGNHHVSSGIPKGDIWRRCLWLGCPGQYVAPCSPQVLFL